MSGVILNKTNNVKRAGETLCKAFAGSAAGDYLMKKFFNIPVTDPVSRERIDALIMYNAALYRDMGGEVAEANNFDAASLWSLPGKHLPAIRTNDPVFNKQFIDDLIQRKKEVIPAGIGYYYLFMIGKDPSAPQVRGSVRKIFEEYKARADAENCAIVLEAISDYAKSVYEYFGFKNYCTFHYGAGEVDSQGNPDPQGEGFTGYLMFYHRDGDKTLKK